MSASDNLSPQQFEHQTGHRPGYYAGLHEADRAYPDVYEKPQYYVGRDPRLRPHELESHRVMSRVRGRPDAEVDIHRALPADLGQVIHPGDWVTPSKGYASHHAAALSESTGKPWSVASMRVPAKHVGLPGDYLPEAGYFPHEPKPGWAE